MQPEAINALADYLASLNLEYSAVFVPQSQSRNAGDKNPTLNWRVTFTRNKRALTTDYMQGIAHLPLHTHTPQSCGTKLYDDYLHDCAERGKYVCDGKPQWRGALVGGSTPIPAPRMADVLHCLVMDADVMNSGTFEEWARDFGYEEDSRKAEAIYNACVKSALELRALIGADAIAELAELMQDY